MPVIDKAKTGKRIRQLMKLRGITVREASSFLSLECVQSIYRWFEGKSLPSIENLYALSLLLEVPMEMLICAGRQHVSHRDLSVDNLRLLQYSCLLMEHIAS